MVRSVLGTYTLGGFAVRLACVLGLGAGAWAFVLSSGVLGGPFTAALVLIFLFFFTLTLVSVWILSRLLSRPVPRLPVYLALTFVGRLLLEIGFLGVGMWQSGERIFAFTQITVTLQVLSLVMTVLVLRRGGPAKR